jgi:MOSC domain-containing protein YiiM
MITALNHLTMPELEASLDHLRQSPTDHGVLELIVARPRVDERKPLTEAKLTVGLGLVGDNWGTRGSSSMPDGSANPEMQITIMNARAVALVAQQRERWELAGDQLFIDLDLSKANLPTGSRLAIGTAVIEVTAPPHNGCKKFVARFGLDAMKFVNSPIGKELSLRGVHARVVQSGVVQVGDVARKI